MATALHDTEEQRFVDRIRCPTYREIRDEMIARIGDSFINRQWISEKLHRGVNFWGNSIWLGNSPEMNTAENIGAIIKDKVEELMTNEDRRNRHSYDVLKTNLESTLKDLEDDTDLFINLLCSMRKRFDALEAARGGHTSF